MTKLGLFLCLCVCGRRPSVYKTNHGQKHARLYFKSHTYSIINLASTARSLIRGQLISASIPHRSTIDNRGSSLSRIVSAMVFLVDDDDIVVQILQQSK